MIDQLRDVQAKARALGVFANDRELLSCPECGLVEDVLVTGLLVTCRPGCPGLDTGLRFVESPEVSGRFGCPECGAEAVPDEQEPGR